MQFAYMKMKSYSLHTLYKVKKEVKTCSGVRTSARFQGRV